MMDSQGNHSNQIQPQKRKSFQNTAKFMVNIDKSQSILKKDDKKKISEKKFNSFFITESKKHTRATVKFDQFRYELSNEKGFESQRQNEEIQSDNQQSLILNKSSIYAPCSASLHNSESFFSQPSQHHQYSNSNSYSYNKSLNNQSNARGNSFSSSEFSTMIKMQLQMYSDINESQFMVLDEYECQIQQSEFEYPHNSISHSYEIPVGPNFQANLPKMIGINQYKKIISRNRTMQNIEMLKLHDKGIDELFFKKEAIFIYKNFIEEIDSSRQTKISKDSSQIKKYIKQNQLINGNLFYLDVNVMRNGYKIYTQGIHKIVE